MSRTKKGSKGLGWECWSRRPHAGKICGRRSNAFAKRLTHKAERREGKQEVSLNVLEESDYGL